MPRRDPLERNIEAYGKRLFKSKGFLVFKLGILGGRGWPDHTIFAPGGRVGFVEYKRPDGKYEPLQQYWMGKLKAFGFVTKMCVVKKDVDNFLKEFSA